jgi:hypothetical protein
MGILVMKMESSSAARAWLPALLFAALLCADTGNSTNAGAAGMYTPDTLRARYSALQPQLRNNQFQRPLHLDSSETANGVNGDIHALINYPFATVVAALNSPGQWCDILMLHLNTKYCRATMAGQENVLNVRIGKKHDQPVNEAHQLAFAYRVAAQSPDYLQVTLNADEGPLSTRDYHIVLEAIPLDNGRTFIHLSYAYAYGVTGRLAMQAYLGTIGRNKVGFTVAGTDDGQPHYIGGMRGVVERNTMRYYLAIEAYLGALSAPPPARLEKRLQDWFAASERYPRQLHEMERDAYLDMKRREHQRQQAALPAVSAG